MASAYGPVQAGVPGPEIVKFTGLFATMHIIGGQIGLPLVLAAMFFSKDLRKRRPPMLINFFLSWVVFSIIFCLLIYTGNESSFITDTPVCYTQAVMIHGAVPLTVSTTFSLVLQLWFGLHYPGGFTTNKVLRAVVTTAMLIFPWVAFFAFTIVSIVIAVEQPVLVNNTASYYCTIRFQPLLFTVPSYAAVVVTAAVGFEIAIIVFILRRWNSMHKLRGSNPALFSMLVRIIIFSVYGFMSLGACVAFISSVQDAAPYLIEASLPLAVFLVFGVRSDVVRAYCFWRRKPPIASMDSTTSLISEGKFRQLMTPTKQLDPDHVDQNAPPVPPKDFSMA